MANQANREGRSNRDNGGSRNWNEIEDSDLRANDERFDYRSDNESRSGSRGARSYREERTDRSYGGSYDDDSYQGGGRGGYDEERGSSRYGREPSGQSDQTRNQGGYGQYSRGDEQRGQYGRVSQGGYGDYGQSGPRQRSQGEDRADYGSSAGQYMRDTRSSRGPHFGKGPKNYSRSDDRLREDANDRLMQDHDLDASNIEVQVKDGEITLSGTVDDRGDKRRAEDIVENIAGVKHVQNNIRVAESDSASTKKTKSTSQTNH